MGNRVAHRPIKFPADVKIDVSGELIKVKGKLGELTAHIDPRVSLTINDHTLQFKAKEADTNSMVTGTTRALVNNMVQGVTKGFEKKLILLGVGYRAQVQGRAIDLTLGFSHPVKVEMPAGINAETPSPTEIIIKGADKQKVAQVAANIRSIRSPEPYKGKGVRYEGEVIILKEGKKK